VAAFGGASPGGRRSGEVAEGRTGFAADLANAHTAIALRISLLKELGSDGLRIHDEVTGGKATLSGTVALRSTQELAEEVALSVPGIRSVDNRVRTEAETQATAKPAKAAFHHTGLELRDALLESRVKLRLLDEIGLVAFNLEVEASDGIVSLRGTLADDEHREIALRTARSTPGTKKVLDLVAVR
jgi:osmotically-inducible protein OsmY